MYSTLIQKLPQCVGGVGKSPESIFITFKEEQETHYLKKNKKKNSLFCAVSALNTKQYSFTVVFFPPFTYGKVLGSYFSYF